MLDANNTTEAIEKLTRYTSHNRTWSFNSDPDATESQKSTRITPAKLSVSHPQTAQCKLKLCFLIRKILFRAGAQSSEAWEASAKHIQNNLSILQLHLLSKIIFNDHRALK